jgi:hypothetical protein
MKKQVVLTDPPTNVVNVNETDRYEFYGVITKDNNRGFIQQESFSRLNSWQVKCFHEFTLSNYWTTTSATNLTLSDYIRKLISDGCEVYQFDTFLELARWTSETQ